MHQALCLLVLVTLAAPADLDFSAVEKHAEQAVAKGESPSLALAVARDGVIVYERAFGYADVEHKEPATVHTPYALASLSKPITATALMRLAERGRVDLSAPVQRYLGPLRLRAAQGDARQVTLLSLLDHTSGLGTYARIYYGASPEPSKALARAVRDYGVLFHPPGRVSEYANLGYGLIGEVIARRSGRSFADFVESEIFRPLGMTDAFVATSSERRRGAARPYDAKGKELPLLYNDTQGAGNLYASARDLVRFGMFHLAPAQTPQAPISRESVERMQQLASPRALHHYYGAAYYGLGWYVRPDDHGRRVLWHEGGMPGASTIIKLIPNDGAVAVVLSNRNDADPLTQALADELLRVVVPGYEATALDPIANYKPYQAQPEYLGRWSGTIDLGDAKLPCTLSFAPEGKIHVSYAETRGATARSEADFGGIVFGDSFVAAFPGRLPVPGADSPSLLLLKLIRDGDVLSGAIVVYASPERLEHALPHHLRLVRERDASP